MTQEELDKILAEMRIEWQTAGRFKRMYLKKRAKDLIDEFNGTHEEDKTERKEEDELEDAAAEWEKLQKMEKDA